MAADLGTRKPPDKCRVRRVVEHSGASRNSMHDNRFRPLPTSRCTCMPMPRRGGLPSMRAPLREVAVVAVESGPAPAPPFCLLAEKSVSTGRWLDNRCCVDQTVVYLIRYAIL